MKKENKLILIIFAMCMIISCSKGSDDGSSGPTPEPNSDPTSVSQLIYPSSDLLCIDNNITFEWSAASDSDGDAISYIVQIAEDRNFNNIVEQRTVSSTNVTIVLQQGIAYYWRVTTIDNQGGEADPSVTFAFYTEGNGVSNHAPFTAALIAPENEGTVGAGTINLSWVGGDADSGDTLTYDLFFGDTMDPPINQSNLSVENFDVTVTSGTTYYWRVDATDNSGIKTIGQTWSFVVN